MRLHVAAAGFLVAAAGCGGTSPPKPAELIAQDQAAPVKPEDDGALGGDDYAGWESDEDHVDEPYVPPPPMPPDLTGTWKSPCAPGAASGEAVSITFAATGSTWELGVDRFGDAACTKKQTTVRFAGRYLVGAASTSAPGAFEVDFPYDARDITAHDAKAAKAVGKACGLKKVKAGQAVDIHAKGCAAFGVRPADACAGHYDLFAQEGSRLRVGVRPADNDTCSADKRPTAIEPGFELAYQWPTSAVAECDRYVRLLDAYTACAMIPVDTRNQIFSAVRTAVGDMLTAFAGLAPAEQKSQCTMIVDSMQQGVDAMGCPVP